MQRKTVWLVVMLALAILTMPLAAYAQRSTKVYRLGYVRTTSGYDAQDEVFKQRLRELGYTEGQNLVIEARFAHGDTERFPALVAELVQLQVDCLVVGGIGAIHAATQATSTIPIVMLNASDDPVRLGLITSLARPGGNLTGIIDNAPALAGKRLALLKEAFPHIALVAHISDKHARPSAVDRTEVEVAARRLGVRIHPLEVQGAEGWKQAFRTAREAGADALIVAEYGFPNGHREEMVKLVDNIRLPAMYTNATFVKSGGLMSYTADPFERSLRAAALVDKILQGAKPADLPVEQPTKFEFVINLKTAQALGLTLPPTLLFQADEVIK